MQIKGVERFVIPLNPIGEMGSGEDGTAVEELILALQALPPKAKVAASWGAPELIVWNHKPDIDPYIAEGLRKLREELKHAYLQGEP